MDKMESRIFRMISTLISKFSNESVVEWISEIIMKSKSQTKFGFSEVVIGLSVKNIKTGNRSINGISKLIIKILFSILTLSLIAGSLNYARKNRKLDDKQKSKILASINLKYKKLFYRGDGFISQLIEVADSIYQPLNKDIKVVFGYSYTEVRNLFIRIYQLRHQKSEQFINLQEIDIQFNDKTFEKIIEDFSISSDTNEEYEGILCRNVINEKPLILINKKLFVPVLPQMIYNLPKAFHYKLLNLQKRFPESEEAKKLKDKYTQVRGKSLELVLFKAIDILADKTCEYAYHDLKYNNGEADVTVQTVDSTILFEVKGKLITLSTYAGDLESFAEDFKLAIQDAYKQALRTEEHIKKSGKFYYANSKKKFVLNKTKQFFKVCVTAENFGATAVELDKHIVLLENVGTIPLSMNIYDLLFIVRNCKSIEELTNYFEYRLEYYGFISSVDELEIFGAFKSKMKFDKVKNKVTMVINQIQELEIMMNILEHEKVMNIKTDII